MRIGLNVNGGAIDKEILQTAHETVTERASPDFWGKFKVRIHVIDATHKQTSN